MGISTFGRSIAEKYFLPYNRKIWKTEPREMGLEWVGRVPKPPMEDVVKSALGIETEGYTHQLHFRYPLAWRFRVAVTGDDPGRVQGTLRQLRSIRSVKKGTAGRSGRPDELAV